MKVPLIYIEKHFSVFFSCLIPLFHFKTSQRFHRKQTLRQRPACSKCMKCPLEPQGSRPGRGICWHIVQFWGLCWPLSRLWGWNGLSRLSWMEARGGTFTAPFQPITVPRQGGQPERGHHLRPGAMPDSAGSCPHWGHQCLSLGDIWGCETASTPLA